MDSSLEEWLLQPAELVSTDHLTTVISNHQEQHDHQEAIAWIPKPILEESGAHSLMSRKASMEPGQSRPLIDPMVTVLGSLHHAHELHTHLLDLQPHDADPRMQHHHEWDEEQQGGTHGTEYYSDDNAAGELDENLKTPLLLSRHSSGHRLETPGALSRKGSAPFFSPIMSRKDSRPGSAHEFAPGSIPESFGSVGNIGGGWQLAWRWSHDGKPGSESHEVGSFQRVFLLQEPMDRSHYSSTMSLPGIGEVEAIQAAALVGPPAQYAKEIVSQNGPALVHPSETATAGPSWKDLLVPGVQRALLVGMGLQILQQVYIHTCTSRSTSNFLLIDFKCFRCSNLEKGPSGTLLRFVNSHLPVAILKLNLLL